MQIELQKERESCIFRVALGRKERESYLTMYLIKIEIIVFGFKNSLNHFRPIREKVE